MAEEEAEKPKEMIKLVSKEGHEFSVEKQAAMVSNTIKSMLTGPGAPLRLLSPPAARRRGAAQGARGARGADGAACGAGMFTENESDTINFPEISKEVLEEVSPAHAPLRQFGVTRSVAHSPGLCARSSSTSTTSCATRTSPCRRSSRSSPPWRWSCSWRPSKTSAFPARSGCSLSHSAVRCAGLTISTPKPACGRGRALLEVARRYKSPRAARSPLCPQALSLVCVPNTQLSPQFPELGSVPMPSLRALRWRQDAGGRTRRVVCARIQISALRTGAGAGCGAGMRAHRN